MRGSLEFLISASKDWVRVLRVLRVLRGRACALYSSACAHAPLAVIVCLHELVTHTGTGTGLSPSARALYLCSIELCEAEGSPLRRLFLEARSQHALQASSNAQTRALVLCRGRAGGRGHGHG